jgi:DNA repair photolyase
MNLHQVSRINLNREAVDCFVFWTKNPENMLSKLDIIKNYQYYFQFTLNPYDLSIEKGVPRKSIIIDTFKKLSDFIGPDRVIWRYDPIIINSAIDVDYHEKYFEALAKRLYNHTSKCIISFIDCYKKTDKVFMAHGIREIEDSTKMVIARKIAAIAKNYNLVVETCAENFDLTDLGIGQSRCIDPSLIEFLLGVSINCKKDVNQRKECGCIESVDIGAYNTCPHGCLYCYANAGTGLVKRNIGNYDVNSPLLCSKPTDQDKIVEREVKSCVMAQKFLF